MKVYCERNCENQIKGVCSLEEIKILSEGCEGFLEKPEFEPFREDNVVVFDNAGIPSIMVKFTRPQNVEEIHPMFIIGGEMYDEIYISKYKNCIINGRAYSLPMQKPATGITLEEAEKACFDKGEGWHLLTAMERGYLANYALGNGTLPHGNTNYGKWHGDPEEKCELYDGCRMLTGSGQASWYHDHTVFGVDGLCGDIYEWFRGLRLMDGKLQMAKDNDAAMNIDLSEESNNWIPVKVGEDGIYLVADDGIVKFTTEEPEDTDYDGCRWEEVQFDFEIPKTLKNLALFNGEPKAYIYVDMNGERLPLCGGRWHSASGAGVFNVNLNHPRSHSYSALGFRSAYYRKRKTEKQ